MAYKHDSLTRLVNILSKLNDGDLLSTKELAEEFNVSIRTIQRDFNERLISFPIEKSGHSWKMQDGFS
jgi:predicted DNA-binding transcriptional regulator YafY